MSAMSINWQSLTRLPRLIPKSSMKLPTCNMTHSARLNTIKNVSHEAETLDKDGEASSAKSMLQN